MRKPKSEEYKQSILAEKNHVWKGENVGYGSLHEWIKSRKIKPDLCEGCKKKKPLDLANISGKYKRELTDWKWLCRKCHMKEDGRLTALQKWTNDELEILKNKYRFQGTAIPELANTHTSQSIRDKAKRIGLICEQYTVVKGEKHYKCFIRNHRQTQMQIGGEKK